MKIYSIGHSNHQTSTLLSMLRRSGVRNLADVRTYPSSKFCPQFNRSALNRSVVDSGMTYTHMSSLGGRRPVQPNSINLGWKHLAFRSYADHMGSEEFNVGLVQLEALATSGPTAFLCTEADPKKCHRYLIGDALQAHGWDVLDIMEKSVGKHVATDFFRYSDGRFLYPKNTCLF